MGREVDSIKHCEKQLPLKWRSFPERSNFPRIWFRDLRFRIRRLEIKHLKAHNFVWQGCFSFIIISQLWRPTELKFSQVCYFIHICWDTPSEKTGLWQLTIVSRVFKTKQRFYGSLYREAPWVQWSFVIHSFSINRVLVKKGINYKYNLT